MSNKIKNVNENNLKTFASCVKGTINEMNHSTTATTAQALASITQVDGKITTVGKTDTIDKSNKWATARTITLGTDCTGNVAIDGSQDVTLNIVVNDNSHNHTASNITSGTLSSDRLPTVPIAKGGTGATTADGALTNLGITATADELNKLDGVTATTSEINYLDGVTSNIQTQLNRKPGNYSSGVRSEIFNDYNNNTASNYSHAEGYNTTASGDYSHAEGYHTTAAGVFAHAGGYGTIANDFQYVVGKCNASTVAPTSLSDKTATAGLFIVGIGTSDSDRSNGFRVDPAGKVYSTGTFGTSGADYAEYFEWFDGNPNNEDRRGHFVTFEGDKIRYATSNDDYILGVVSAEPSVAGDVHSENWHNKYLKDIFGSKIVEVVGVEEAANEDGEIIPAHTERRWVLNPDYDPDVKYISREERPEWATIGIVGKIVVVDDGTCQVNGYCQPNADGIATASQGKTNYRVMERLDDTHIRIFVR